MAAAAIAIGLGAAAATVAVHTAKKKLARYLAESISEYFEVDPESIESSLVRDGRLLLQELRLKPLYVISGTRIEGEVEKVEFSWKWGGSKDGSTEFVRDAVLAISGPHFRIIKTDKKGSVEKLEVTDDAQVDENVGATVQQIIDHLALNVNDLRLTIEKEGEQAKQNVVIEAKSFKLVSLGRESETESSEHSTEALPQPPLLQRISLDSFCAYIDSQEEGRLWILEPFGYTASVKRVAGKRFGGLESGLQIAGETMDAKGVDSNITIHAGTFQIQALLQIMDMLVLPDDAESGIPMSKDQGDDDPYSTVLFLPLPSVKVILPNGSAIRMPNVSFHYCTDGSLCSLQATGGLLVNDDRYLLKLEDSTRAVFDFTSNKVSVELTTLDNAEDVEFVDDQIAKDAKGEQSSSEHIQEVAHIIWQEHEMRPVVAGVRDVMVLIETGTAQESGDGASTSPPWTLVLVDGKIAMRMEGGTQWIEASLDSPSTYVLADRPDEAPSQVSIGGATFGPTSFGNIFIRLSAVTMEADSFLLTSFTDIQNFIDRAMGLDAW